MYPLDIIQGWENFQNWVANRPVTLEAFFKELQTAHGLPVDKDFAEFLGLTPFSLSRLKTGQRTLNTVQLEKIFSILGIPPRTPTYYYLLELAHKKKHEFEAQHKNYA